MNPEKITAVVVGDDHQNTLGVIRSLGEAGCAVKAVILSDGKDNSTAHSRYIEECFLIRAAELPETLVQIGAAQQKKSALIPCGDGPAAVIARNFDRLSQLYHLPRAGDGANMLRLMNKRHMLEAAREAGLNVPRWICAEGPDFSGLEEDCGGLRFPCILKPLELLSGGRFEFRILQTREELSGAMDYIRENCRSVMLQEYIRKTGEYGVNGCRLLVSGRTISDGVIEKKRFSQSSLGSTTAGTILPDEHGLCEAARKFVEHIDYRGIFDMEFITDGREFYFVEMNFRNGGYGYAYTKAGRNLPAIWAAEADGQVIDAYLAAPMEQVFFINESADLQNVRAGNVSVFGWLWDVLRADAHMYINRRDWRPVLKKFMR